MNRAASVGAQAPPHSRGHSTSRLFVLPIHFACVSGGAPVRQNGAPAMRTPSLRAPLPAEERRNHACHRKCQTDDGLSQANFVPRIAERSTRSEARSGCASLKGICALHQRAMHGVGFGCHQQELRSRGCWRRPLSALIAVLLAPRASERPRPSLSRQLPDNMRRLRHLGDGQGSNALAHATTNVPVA